MLRNLVENAVHYTPSTPERQGVVTVRVLVDPYSKALVIQVEDNGLGIPAAERDLVFQPFYRALGTNVDGSGLGLPIVKEIAQQHGASITVDAAHPGQTPPGACFTLRFNAPA
jgi:two-component system sensor histidine kinase TctE